MLNTFRANTTWSVRPFLWPEQLAPETFCILNAIDTAISAVYLHPRNSLIEPVYHSIDTGNWTPQPAGSSLTDTLAGSTYRVFASVSTD